MAHPISYGMKGYQLVAPVITLATDSSLNTGVAPLQLNVAGGGAGSGNVSTFIGGQIAPGGALPTVDTGTVATYQTRGVAATTKAGWIKLRDYWPGSGQLPTVLLEIPAIQVLTTTGSPTTLYPFGVTNVLPAIYRPTFNQSFPVDLVNNSSFVIGRCTITTAGVVSLTLIGSGAFTAPFGLNLDTNIEYQITPVGL